MKICLIMCLGILSVNFSTIKEEEINMEYNLIDLTYSLRTITGATWEKDYELVSKYWNLDETVKKDQ